MAPETDEVIIERPDEHEPGSELYCFMPGNWDRECNGSCVAFDERSIISPDRFESCKVLTSMRAMSGALGLVGKGVSEITRAAKSPDPYASAPPPEVK